MKPPKIKPKTLPPKTLKRTVRTPKGVKTSLNNSIDNIHKMNKANKALQKHIPDNQQYDKPENYAADNVIEKGEYLTRKVGGKTAETTRKAVNKGHEKIREHHNAKQREKYDKRFNDDIGKETGPQIKTKVKTYAQNQAKKTADKSSKIRHTADGKKSVKNAIHTGGKTTKNIKTSKKGIKNTKRTVKTTTKGVKTAAKTTTRTAQTAKKSVIMAKKAAVETAKFAKLTVKAIVTAVKAVIVAVKSIVAAIAAGGWVVVVIIIIIAAIIAIVSSPLAIFTNDTNGTTPTISEVVQEINGEYAGEITGIITDAGDIDEIIIESEAASSEFYVSNWIDVIGIFIVKSTVTSSDEEFIPVIYMEDKQINDLKDVFWNMNTISYEIIEEVIEPEPTPTPSQTSTPNPTVSPTETPEPTSSPTPEIYRTLIISIESKTYENGIEMYNMSDKQIEVLEELMTLDYLPLFMEICGMDSYIGLTSEQMANLIKDLPEGELGSVIVEYALTRLGHPYSQAKRGQGNYVDCSYLTRWSYQQAGVSHFTAGTAAEQTRYCVNNGLCISYSNLQPGDLIFWSFNVNGRFMNVTHVGIYAGNGYVIDASSSRGMVVYRLVFAESSIVACGRPHVK